MMRLRRQNKADKSIDLANFNRAMDRVNQLSNITVANGMVRYDPSGVHIAVAVSPAAEAMDYSDFAFGFSISGAVVKVNSGKIRQGTRTPISVSSADKIIRADQSFIFVTYTYGSGLAVLGSPTIVEPVDTEEVHNHVLYLVTLTAGVASVESGNIKHLGDIWLPGSFA